MPVLSIIACGMLEDELVHVLSKDPELKQLIVVEDRNSLEFLRKLRSKNCTPITAYLDRVPQLLNRRKNFDSKTCIKLLSFFPLCKKILKKRESIETKEVTVVVNLLRLGLHSNLEQLKAKVYENIREMASFSDKILVFYGSCGDTFDKLQEDFKGLNCTLSLLTDNSGEMVDDCISLALGGNDAYARCMLEFRGMGTIYLTPMWASSWKKLEKEANGREFNNKYLKNPLYCLAAKIDTGVADNSLFDENVKEFAFRYNMKVAELKGSMEIAERSYLAARNTTKKGPESR